MLFFVDESWHTASNGKAKAGVLAAIQVKMVEMMEFRSRATWEAPDGQKRSWSGFKEIREVKEKEAGDLGAPTETQKPIREPVSSPPTSHPKA